MDSVVDKVLDEKSAAKVNHEVDALKSSFGQLRSDVVDLISHAFGIGKTGADAAKGSATDAIDNLKSRLSDLKDRGADQVSSFEQKIEENPLPAALIAFGVGFVIAKILSRR